MVDVEKIRAEYERNVKALKLRPAIGQRTAVTKVRVRDNLVCDIEDGAWKLTAASKSGDSEAGPVPGVFGRAALGSCLALGYMGWAARLGVPLSGVEVEVQADLDARGNYGIDDVPAGYTEVRYIVTIESPAPEDDITRVLDTADAHSPWLNNLSRPMKLRREVRMAAPQD